MPEVIEINKKEVKKFLENNEGALAVWYALLGLGIKEEFIIKNSLWIKDHEELGNVWILPLTDYYCMVLSPERNCTIEYLESDCKTAEDIATIAQNTESELDVKGEVQNIMQWEELDQIAWRMEAIKGFKDRLEMDSFHRFNRLER